MGIHEPGVANPIGAPNTFVLCTDAEGRARRHYEYRAHVVTGSTIPWHDREPQPELYADF